MNGSAAGRRIGRVPGVRRPGGAAANETLCALVLTAVATGLGGTPRAAAAQLGAGPQHVVENALAMQAAGDFDRARASLEQALSACGGAAADAPCRALFASSLGYLYHLRLRQDASPPDSLYQAARQYYELARREDPEDADVVYNLGLLYREQGAHEWQEPFLRSAPELDPSRRATYRVMLGDYYREQTRWDAALQAYREALDAAPEDAAGRAGLVEVYAALGPGRLGELLELAADWERTSPDQADRAYDLVVVEALRAAEAGQSALLRLAEEALVRRVALHARTRRISAASVARLPAAWPPVRDLVGYLEAPHRGPASGSWWTGTEARRRVLAQVALAVGAAHASHGRSEAADAVWSAALEFLPEPFPERLDLTRELALLWFRHASLDPEGRRFVDLEAELFLEKAETIAGGDIEAIQRFHTTLGLIYAQKEVWSSRNPARNAVQQIEWALAVAARREARDGFYQPLPELNEILARGWLARGESGMAAEAYHRAAIAFLDMDALDAAARALRGAGPRQTAALRELIAFRRSLAALAQTPGEEAADPCNEGTIGRVVERARNAGAPAHFPSRQRFKILADCAERGPVDRRLDFAAATVELTAAGMFPLVGIGDLLRYERAAGTVLRSVRMPFQRPHSERGQLPASGTRDVSYVRITLPGEGSPAYFAVTPETVLATRIVRVLDPRETSYRLRIQDGAVEITTESGALSPAADAAVRRLPGVAGMRVKS